MSRSSAIVALSLVLSGPAHAGHQTLFQSRDREVLLAIERLESCDDCPIDVLQDSTRILTQRQLPKQLRRRAIDVLITCLSEEALRHHATRALGQFGAETYDALLDSLEPKETPWRQKTAAIDLLSKQPLDESDSSRFVAILIGQLEAKHSEMRRAALGALSARMDQAMSPLVDALLQSPKENNRGLLILLAEVPEPMAKSEDYQRLLGAREPLVELLSDSDPRKRAAALEILDQLEVPATPPLWRLLWSSNKDVRDFAAHELVARGTLPSLSAIDDLQGLDPNRPPGIDGGLVSKSRGWFPSIAAWLPMVLKFLSYGVLVGGSAALFGSMYFRHLRARREANAQVMEETFGEALHRDEGASGQRCRTLLQSLDLREGRPECEQLVRVAEAIKRTFALSKVDLWSSVPEQRALAEEVLAGVAAKRASQMTEQLDVNALEVVVSPTESWRVTLQELSLANLPTRLGLAAAMIREDWFDRLTHAGRFFTMLESKWHLRTPDYAAIGPTEKARLWRAALVDEEHLAQTIANINSLSDLFRFLSRSVIAKLSAEEKINLFIGVSHEPAGLMRLRESTISTLLKPMHIDSFGEFCQMLDVSQEVLYRMMGHYESMVLELWRSDTQRQLIEEELVRESRERVAKEVAHRAEGELERIPQESIKVLMKTGPILRLIRARNDEIRQLLQDTEHQTILTNTKLVVRLLELAEWSPERQVALRSHVAQRLKENPLDVQKTGWAPGQARELINEIAADFTR
ncbi:hypothetical protein Pan216_10400 [Planctomycetes bacterium Pan216]|uniref:HEAT repeat protein n=1 Tax=Kolteria novifilia TaxID=2527975 RepID=A0A518AZR5_9BACT|nr:hypothetical protein Pan216_10400 [Planctomycetes bacterium Pan216]